MRDLGPCVVECVSVPVCSGGGVCEVSKVSDGDGERRKPLNTGFVCECW